MHAPVTPDTAGMIGKVQLDAMKDGVVYVNTARAALHDTDALVAALQSGKVGAAGLDHFEGEHLRRSIRWRAWTTSCSPPTSAVPPTTPRPTTAA